MTDKQIIIDGIDVSRCRHYDNRYGYCEACKDDIDGASFTKCLYEDNCYYKQLKAKEQRIVELNKTIKSKEQECERLSKENYELTEEVSIDRALFAEIDQLKAENDELKVRNIEYMNGNIGYQLKNSLYKQTLTEIKEIAEAESYLSPQSTRLLVHKILQKISEVSNDMENN